MTKRKRKFKYIVLLPENLPYNSPEIKEMIVWINASCGGHKQAYKFHQPFDNFYVSGFKFWSESDAALFKLSWV